MKFEKIFSNVGKRKIASGLLIASGLSIFGIGMIVMIVLSSLFPPLSLLPIIGFVVMGVGFSVAMGGVACYKEKIEEKESKKTEIESENTSNNHIESAQIKKPKPEEKFFLGYEPNQTSTNPLSNTTNLNLKELIKHCIFGYSKGNITNERNKQLNKTYTTNQRL